MSRRIGWVALGVLCLVGGATRAQTGHEWSTYPVKQAPAAMQPAIQRADLVILSIQDATSAELTSALSAGGPGDAIQVCHIAATTLIHRLGRDEGIAAGRTSAQLRVPSNAPKPWAAPIVKQFATTKAASVDGFAVDLGDKVGVMRPIAHRAICTPCHGVDEKLNPRVRQELKDRYPADRATGFKDGDLRGWIWVEVPKQKVEKR